MTELEHWMRSADKWKKIADRQQKEIEKLREAVEGYENGQDGIYAMIAAVVQKVGTVTITRDEINEIVRDGRRPRVSVDVETWRYTLSMEDESDGERAAEAD